MHRLVASTVSRAFYGLQTQVIYWRTPQLRVLGHASVASRQQLVPRPLYSFPVIDSHLVGLLVRIGNWVKKRSDRFNVGYTNDQLTFTVLATQSADGIKLRNFSLVHQSEFKVVIHVLETDAAFGYWCQETQNYSTLKNTSLWCGSVIAWSANNSGPFLTLW
jgi:hypothetical protein